MIHKISCGKEYFSNLTLRKVNVNAISSPIKIIDVSKNATITLPNCSTLRMRDVLLSSRSKRNLLSFKDVCLPS